MRPATLYDVPIAVALEQTVAQMLFSAVEVERRQILAVRHRLESIAGAADTNELLHVRVPWRNVVVSNRPVDSVAEFFWRDEFVLAPALAGAAPNQRFTSDLISTNPVERFLLHVRMV